MVALYVVGFGTIKASRAARAFGHGFATWLARATHGLLALQILFGWLTVTSGVKLHSVMSHVGGAALLLGTLTAFALAAAGAGFVPATAASPNGPRGPA